MNYLLFDESDLNPSGRLVVNGRRAEHLLSVLRVVTGQRVRVGKLGGGLGEATVCEIGAEKVTLELHPETREVPECVNVTLILATPRPQSLKKVLQSAAAIGVSKILLISAARVEKAYFSSPVLREEQIRAQLMLGLEQAGATELPEVQILPGCKLGGRAKSGADDRSRFELAVQQTSRRLVPHPGAGRRLSELFSERMLNRIERLAIAVGPEGGWIEQEMAAFEELGFQAFCLGHRVLRVETAVDVLLGQLQLLREMERV